ncbi:MAG: hypothetical protein PHU25_09155 [Deltaproteobacteria bacterium]|nr:hypothetical protein [Deltaproteobacteria bacterium]
MWLKKAISDVRQRLFGEERQPFITQDAVRVLREHRARERREHMELRLLDLDRRLALLR